MKCIWCEKTFQMNQQPINGMHSKCYKEFQMTVIAMAKQYHEMAKNDGYNPENNDSE